MFVFRIGSMRRETVFGVQLHLSFFISTRNLFLSLVRRLLLSSRKFPLFSTHMAEWNYYMFLVCLIDNRMFLISHDVEVNLQYFRIQFNWYLKFRSISFLNRCLASVIFNIAEKGSVFPKKWQKTNLFYAVLMIPNYI